MLKKLVRGYTVHVAALLLTTQIVTGLQFTGGTQTLLAAAFVFSLLRIFIHPILKLLLLPVNLLTANLMAWSLDLITLYGISTLVPQVTIASFTLPSYNLGLIVTPSYEFTSFLTALGAAFTLSITTRFLGWFVS